MTLSQAIIKCMDYIDTDESMYSIYAKKVNGRFRPDSEALVLKLTIDEMEMKSIEVAEKKCPGFDYFLEIFVLKDFYEDLLKLEEFKTDIKRVERIIYYAEFDA
ncbi:hypothetical protein [Flavobacterium johnsoniae]|uniref:hypothetical protein n=1 Tax=Flavobacterium johnsoniae TaxID=986 RepID=UPI0033967637